MELARSLTVALSALVFLACSETAVAPSDPQVPPQRLELKAGTEFDITVSSDIIIIDEQKQKKTFKHKKVIHARVQDGLAVALGVGEADDNRLTSMNTEEVLDPSINFMPVLAIATGELVGSHDDNAYDENGNIALIQTGSESASAPATMMKVHLNGVYQITTHMNWAAVSGGYLMSEQVQTASDASGTQSQIRSTADISTLQVTMQPSKAQSVLASAQSAVRRMACWIGPSVAYAATVSSANRYESASMMAGCLGQGAWFAANTAALGFAPYRFPVIAGTGQISTYLLAWSSWTKTSMTCSNVSGRTSRAGSRRCLLVNTHVVEA